MGKFRQSLTELSARDTLMEGYYKRFLFVEMDNVAVNIWIKITVNK